MMRRLISVGATLVCTTVVSAQILPGGGGAAGAAAGGPPVIEELFVDATNTPGPGTGARTNPYLSLHDALTNADPSKQTNIYVRGSSGGMGLTYKPSSPSSPSIENSTFLLSNHVAVIGGWDGGTIGAINVDPATNIVTLSGDHGSNQNSYHVLTAPSTASGVQYVTGCIIREGVADDPGGAFNPNRYGGGLFVEGATVYVADCIFTMNHAEKAGGAIYNGVDGTADVIRCQFLDNTATVCGGAIANNDAGFTGGSSNGRVEVWNSQFFDNVSIFGGAVFTGGADVLDVENVTLIINCELARNVASGDGGAISTQGGDRPPSTLIYSSRMYDNEAGVGGAIFVVGGSPFWSLPTELLVVNSSFCSNLASSGGAIYIPEGGGDDPDVDYVDVGIINCTFTGNIVTSSQGGALFAGEGYVHQVNTIMWGNIANGLANQISLGFPAPDVVVSYSDVEGGWAGTGNLNVNPQFGTITRCDVPLSGSTPGSIIDASNMTPIPLDYLDIDDDGNTTERLPDVLLGSRVLGSAADLGANEDQ